jgi:hypothetical protein
MKISMITPIRLVKAIHTALPGVFPAENTPSGVRKNPEDYQIQAIHNTGLHGNETLTKVQNRFKKGKNYDDHRGLVIPAHSTNRPPQCGV